MKLDNIVDTLKETQEFNTLSKKTIKGIIESSLYYIREAALNKGEEVSIAGFGKFVKLTREGVSESNFGKGIKYKSTKLGFKPFSASKIKG